MTLADTFEAAAWQFAARIAYVDGAPGGQRITFDEWYQRSDSLAGALVERGVVAGDVVAIMLGSSIEFAIAFGAATLAGAVVTSVNTRLGVREIDAILEQGRPRLIFFDPDAFAVAAADSVSVMLLNEIVEAYAGTPLGDWRPLRNADDPAVIIWTSGTTGVPKGAWFDHHNLEAAVASAGVMSHPYDVKLVSTPFAHAGYMSKMWDQLAWATTTVISPTPWRATDMVRLIEDEAINVVAGVPTQWSKLLSEPGVENADLSSVRLGLAATASAPPELIERVASTIGCPLVVRYAMTESPSIAGTDVADPPEVQYQTVGRPQAGIQIELVDENGKTVVAGEVGRVKVRGGCVMRGYWNAPQLTASVLDHDGWLTTSDLAKFRPDGNLVLVGRTSDMYIRGGYNIYPLEVEHVLAEHPLVDMVAVVGHPMDVIGEIGVAFVVPTHHSNPPTLEDLRSWVADRLADYKAPDRLEVVDTLPLTSMMKVDKLALTSLIGS